MDRIAQFEIFVRVAETGSFTKAASTLDLPRSTVSTAIADLERRLGTRLLSRTTRQVALTPDGSAFYDKCLGVIADFEEAEVLFRRDGTRPIGKVNIDVPGRIGRLILAPALPSFFMQYPGIQLQLGVTDRAVDLIGDNVDCALRVGRLADSDLIARQIGNLPLINVASPDYLARHGIPKNPDDLVNGHHMVAYASPTTHRTEDWEWVETGVVHTCPVVRAITVNNAEGYIACCLAGLGLIQIPAYDVAGHVRSGDLVEVMPDYRAPSMPMTLLHPHRHHQSHRVQIFSDWLVALLRGQILFE